MKLSDAIEQGAEKYKRQEKVYFGWEDCGEVVSACALGSAAMIVSSIHGDVPPYDITDSVLGYFFPELYDSIIDGKALFEKIVLLNDTKHWPRKAIAAWLRKQGY